MHAASRTILLSILATTSTLLNPTAAQRLEERSVSAAQPAEPRDLSVTGPTTINDIFRLKRRS